MYLLPFSCIFRVNPQCSTYPLLVTLRPFDDVIRGIQNVSFVEQTVMKHMYM